MTDLDRLERKARRVLELQATLGPLHSSLAETGEGAAALELFRAAASPETVLWLIDGQRKLLAALVEALDMASNHALVSPLDKSAPRDLQRITEMRMEFHVAADPMLSRDGTKPGELARPLRDGEYSAYAKATVDIRELPDSPPMVTEVTFRPAFDEAPNCVVRTLTKDEMDAMAELRAASDRQLEAQAAPGQVERDVTSALVGYPLLYGRKTVRAAPSFEVTGPPMRGKCVGCGIDLDVLVANGKLGHVCNGRPPMDIDHLHKLVTACIEECDATNDTGPAYDELVAYLGECGFVSRTVVAKAMAGVTADVIADVVWKGKLFMLGRGLVEACDIAESWGPKTSEAQQAIFQDRIAELREMAVKFNATGDAQPDFVDVVFDGPPGREAGRFVEVEDSNGNSISIGEWIDRKDGMWALRIPRAVQR